jgi:hypothetical protein
MGMSTLKLPSVPKIKEENICIPITFLILMELIQYF